ncbi:MAG: hypothetical protein IJ125_03675 [Atopobiaceae bacterium]|nr:hypothetical protein [Atopobiaceae bacterium]
MDARSELVMRCAHKRALQIGPLSNQAFAELMQAVSDSPQDFIDDEAEQSFALLGDVLAYYKQSLLGDEFLDDESFFRARKQRLSLLRERCEEVVTLDSSNVDARLLLVLSSDDESNEQLRALIELEHELDGERGQLEPGNADAWEDVFLRPRLRVKAAIVRACLDSARYGLCVKKADELMRLSPSDELGARLSCALAYARLENEAGFDELDMRYDRRGNAWFYLARVLLMFKLDRMAAARRALAGFNRLCMGGAYALLRPTFVDTYLPDRPFAETGSFEEAHMAVHEADPVVVDTPDFVGWAQSQPDFEKSAVDFAQRYGFDW